MTLEALRFKVTDSGDIGALNGDGSLIVQNRMVMQLPRGCRIDSVENQYGVFWLWVLGEEGKRNVQVPTVPYTIYIVGPGYPPPALLLDADEWRKLGACHVRGGEQIYHVYGRMTRGHLATGEGESTLDQHRAAELEEQTADAHYRREVGALAGTLPTE